MKNIDFRKILPYVTALLIFIALTLVYFNPLLEGKRLKQGDITNWKGMSNEISDYREKLDREILWTNSMFGGMPSYHIYVAYSGNKTSFFDKYIAKFRLSSPANFVMIYFVGFFILLLLLGVNPWLSIAGAIAFAFSSYFFIILEAGHNTKAHAIGYIAPVLGSVILLFRKKYLLGGLLTVFFLSLQIRTNHQQITFYLLLMLVILGIVEFIYSINKHELKNFFTAAGVIFIAGLFALITNVETLWPVYEYSDYTIRGKSELSFNKHKQTGGLDRDYATAWSYGVDETLTLLIPNFKGGSSHSELSTNSNTYKVLSENRVPNARQIVKQMPTYWGDQPFTSGPVYVGAIICFLFVLGIIIVPGRLKWWLVITTILSIFLAWGHNFSLLTNFFLDYVPVYNKLRAPSMALVIAEVAMPILALLALKEIYDGKVTKKKLLKALKISLGITGGLSLVFVLVPGMFFNFSTLQDSQLPDWLRDAVMADRQNMLRIDALRSLVFILLTAGLVYLFVKKKIKPGLAVFILSVLFLLDMWPVNKRYLNNDNFDRKANVEFPFKETLADTEILKDETLYFRVYNLSEPFDKSARTSYFHKNIGGYHGAKFRRYQELIDYQLTGEREEFVKLLSNSPTNLAMNASLMQMKIFNMLNTRYFIYNLDAPPLINYNALGNAWFVPGFEIVINADREMTALNDFNPQYQAIINQEFEPYLEGYANGYDSAGYINLTTYIPDHLTYEYSLNRDQLTLFSEIYYKKGWQAYVDGEPIPYFRANYVLRAAILPAGEHTFEFIFEPRSFYVGYEISFISSLFLIGLILFYLMRKLYINFVARKHK